MNSLIFEDMNRKVQRDLIDYVEACDEQDKPPVSDATMVISLAVIFLNKRQILYCLRYCMWRDFKWWAKGMWKYLTTEETP